MVMEIRLKRKITKLMTMRTKLVTMMTKLMTMMARLVIILTKLMMMIGKLMTMMTKRGSQVFATTFSPEFDGVKKSKLMGDNHDNQKRNVRYLTGVCKCVWRSFLLNLNLRMPEIISKMKMANLMITS